ncbi:hypothetical protein GRI97_05145 [Altererythrobacter xixiisoli]|uniref:Uncharacterized protein n=1 Tax=Croceibacterium xixiisoli TaxID=1476466 RepID=A0A6I4TT49_9SPHN|nr:hypothetical protein [Croceibacterium xixiisoli]MXO98370.1 hypothetical protein [Croceibacterium xixiisoli]
MIQSPHNGAAQRVPPVGPFMTPMGEVPAGAGLKASPTAAIRALSPDPQPAVPLFGPTPAWILILLNKMARHG